MSSIDMKKQAEERNQFSILVDMGSHCCLAVLFYYVDNKTQHHHSLNQSRYGY